MNWLNRKPSVPKETTPAQSSENPWAQKLVKLRDAIWEHTDKKALDAARETLEDAPNDRFLPAEIFLSPEGIELVERIQDPTYHWFRTNINEWTWQALQGEFKMRDGKLVFSWEEYGTKYLPRQEDGGYRPYLGEE